MEVKQLIVCHVEQCARDVLADTPEHFRTVFRGRVALFLLGVEQLEPTECTPATFDEFRTKMSQVCEAFREDCRKAEENYRWN